MSDLPIFNFNVSQYDQSKLLGRIKYFYKLTNPLTLFTSKKKLNNSILILNRFRNGTLLNEKRYIEMKNNDPNGFNKMLWDARNIKESIIHPDTNKPIFPLFRFSFYGLSQFMIIPLMIAKSTIISPQRTIAIHFINQSYNAGCNYANRNITNTNNSSTFIKGYIGAVFTSVSLALGATVVANKSKKIPKLLQSSFRIGLPFTACVVAGCTNLVMVRQEELSDGIQLFDNNNNMVGKSKLAARDALMKCSMARFIWNIPIMIGVPLIIKFLERMYPIIIKNPRLGMLTNVFISGTMCMIAIPPSLGLFPQYDSLNVDELEDKYHNIYDKNNKRIEWLYFNKGL
jgi:sideroflexin-5